MSDMNAMDLLIAGRYRRGIKIRDNNLSEAYLGEDTTTGQEVEIQLVPVGDCRQLENGARVCKILEGRVGIPSVHWSGRHGDPCHFALVHDLLGPSLEDLLGFCGGKCSIKTVTMLADQLITRLETIHDGGIVHGEVTITNLLIGLGKWGTQVTIANFGNARRWSPSDKRHYRPFRGDENPGVEISPRRDMESLGYVFFVLLGGILPVDSIALSGKEIFCRLSRDLPQEFAEYLDYSKSLEIDQKPDYGYLRKLFRGLFTRETFQLDFVFDWTIHKYASQGKVLHYQSTRDEGRVLLQLVTCKPISQQQLTEKIEGIYAGLVKVEEKCHHVDEEEKKLKRKLSSEQWQALGALHHALLKEHYDYLVASNHPSSPPSLVEKRAMHARFWDKGVHSMLELLKDGLPETAEQMRAFLRLSYAMVALFLETVPEESTWITYLRDLAQYRMELERANDGDYQIWSDVERSWSERTTGKSPDSVGQQNHLTLPVPIDYVQQLFYHAITRASVEPFQKIRESIKDLSERLLNAKKWTSIPSCGRTSRQSVPFEQNRFEKKNIGGDWSLSSLPQLAKPTLSQEKFKDTRDEESLVYSRKYWLRKQILIPRVVALVALTMVLFVCLWWTSAIANDIHWWKSPSTTSLFSL